MPQMYNTITPENNISIIDHNFQVELKNLMNKYCDSGGKSKDAAIVSDVQVEKYNQESLISASAS